MEVHLESELTPELAEAIAILARRSFTSDTSVDERVATMLAAAKRDVPETISGRRFVIWENDRLVGHARTFVRNIKAAELDIPVLALATVCTEPERRGKGFGAMVTRKALDLVHDSDWPDVSLFQSPVPAFYEKLNCRVVGNRFVNRLNSTDPEANPWRNDTVMVYPAQYDWPTGIIDLNGPDY